MSVVSKTQGKCHLSVKILAICQLSVNPIQPDPHTKVCKFSRIWGGIHPPADDIPGRLVGEKIGIDAFNFATSYFEVDLPPAPPESTNHIVYPIPNDTGELYVANTKDGDKFYLFDLNGSQIAIKNVEYNENNRTSRLSLSDFISTGMYLLRINNNKARRILVKSR